MYIFAFINLFRNFDYNNFINFKYHGIKIHRFELPDGSVGAPIKLSVVDFWASGVVLVAHIGRLSRNSLKTTRVK